MESRGEKRKEFIPSSTGEARKKIRGPNVNLKQRTIYVDFCTNQRSVMEPSAFDFETKWAELGNLLNKAGPPQKSVDDWKKNFQAWMYQIRHKMRLDDEYQSNPARGPDRNKYTLNNLETRAISLHGIKSVVGDDDLSARGVPEDAQNLPETDNENGVEIVPGHSTANTSISMYSDNSPPPVLPVQETFSQIRKTSSVDVHSENLKTYMEMKKQRDAEKKQREERYLSAFEKLSEGILLIARRQDSNNE
ncbi:uncharacterized protein LOC129804032 isoform X1 [Phlebotomus papatasi]|uniref:uncharacterized protein LOC129804032 isoform X1 n=2 Tax=Phlebotomus papatasi TaxID=29031 RepID=UPI0024836A66|nr:uncharacterized protein LOC129804032 isoform X1 [Phlebotomus papatasi]